jgi:hypothetical protein
MLERRREIAKKARKVNPFHLVPGRHSVTILAEEVFAVLVFSFGLD